MFKNADKIYKISIMLVCWAVLFLVIINIVSFFNDLVSILAVSLAITYILLWPVKIIESILPETQKVSKRFIATLTTYILSIIIFVILIILMVQPVSRQLIELSQVLPKYIVELEQNSIDYMDKMSSQYGLTVVNNVFGTGSTIKKPEDLNNLSTEDKKKAQAAIIEENFYKQLQNLANYGAQALQDIALGTFRNFIYAVLVLMLSFFFLIGTSDIRGWVENFFKEKHYELFTTIEKKIHEALFGYIRGQAIIGFLTGLFMWIIYTVFDLKYALVLALFMGFGQFIPFIGQTLAIIPAVIVALVKDPLTAMIVLIIFLIFQIFSNNVLVPKILGDMTGLNPIIVIISIIIGERIGGIIGVLIAVPVASIIQILFVNLYLPLTRTNGNSNAIPPPEEKPG